MRFVEATHAAFALQNAAAVVRRLGVTRAPNSAGRIDALRPGVAGQQRQARRHAARELDASAVVAAATVTVQTSG